MFYEENKSCLDIIKRIITNAKQVTMHEYTSRTDELNTLMQRAKIILVNRDMWLCDNACAVYMMMILYRTLQSRYRYRYTRYTSSCFPEVVTYQYLATRTTEEVLMSDYDINVQNLEVCFETRCDYILKQGFEFIY